MNNPFFPNFGLPITDPSKCDLFQLNCKKDKKIRLDDCSHAAYVVIGTTEEV